MNDDPNTPFPQAGCCAQCHYFQPLDELNGHCHRYPPAYAGNSSRRSVGGPGVASSCCALVISDFLHQGRTETRGLAESISYAP